MLFCPKNDTLFPAWSNHGISLCFMETISISIIGLFMVVFGSGQMIVYRKYSTRLLSLPLRRKKLYNVQIFITFLLPLVTMLRFLLEAFLLKTRVIYGYMVCGHYPPTTIHRWPFSYWTYYLFLLSGAGTFSFSLYLPVFVCTGVCREALPVALGTFKGSWLRPLAVLDYGIRVGESVPHEY